MTRSRDAGAPRTWRRRIARLALGTLSIAPLSYLLAWGAACDVIGADAVGTRLTRMQGSPQWSEGRFVNRLPRVDGPPSAVTSRWLWGKDAHSEPHDPIPVLPRVRADFETPPSSGLRVTWLGHSTLIVEIDGKRVLVDPVWGERASPFSFMGPKRFYPMPLALDALPPIDAVLISHDHYDHLDTPTVRHLATKMARARFIVPLGVGADLERWGVAPGQIDELDWWDAVALDELTVTATPARHFSGRWVDDQSETLWCGFTLVSPRHRVYYSGDTALFPELVDIGARLGPFDVTMIESGAYDALWPDVHLGPEQAVRAHVLARGRLMLPVHWGMFDLALHGWTEPIERVRAEAKRRGVAVRSPQPGAMIEIDAPPAGDAPADTFVEDTPWWPSLPWRTAREAPVVSSHIDAIRE